MTVELQAELAEKVAVTVQEAPLEVKPVNVYGILAGNGALTTTGVPPQLLVNVTVPVVGGLVIESVPDKLYKLVVELQAPGTAVNPVTPQTIEQSVVPVPEVWEKVISPATSA